MKIYLPICLFIFSSTRGDTTPFYEMLETCATHTNTHTHTVRRTRERIKSPCRRLGNNVKYCKLKRCRHSSHYLFQLPLYLSRRTLCSLLRPALCILRPVVGNLLYIVSTNFTCLKLLHTHTHTHRHIYIHTLWASYPNLAAPCTRLSGKVSFSFSSSCFSVAVLLA